ncbi:MAG: DNA repair protein RecN [Halioglobus sp.]
MLSHISIQNYTIVETLEMEFAPGMTVITGETGAGKSIMLDALALCLGDRADPKAIRPGSDRAEIAAEFDISAIPLAQEWLRSRDLLAGDEVLLRRVVTAEGRSRAYINGSTSTLQDCTALGEHLIDIHSQHAHQSLLRKATQRALVDAFAGHQKLATEIETLASSWLRDKHELQLLTSAQDEQAARAQLLGYQVDELNELALAEGELGKMELEHKQLANAEEILASVHESLTLCVTQEAGTRQALHLLDGDAHVGKQVVDVRELLDSAAIQINEARSELQAYSDSIELDPERLDLVQRRLESVYAIARKHRVQPEQLAEKHATLQEELDGLTGSGERIGVLEENLAALATQYGTAAGKLTKQRRRAAKKLVTQATAVLSTLAMEQCVFEVALLPRESSDPHPQGQEDVEFLISTNPGAPTQPLGKIASGGELSRISLAIQVVTANVDTVPSMVFDEVDVGIGGAVAEVVGKLLRDLAAKAQVLCVTHLPQVAAQGQQHLQVSKTASKSNVSTSLHLLDSEQTVQEVARMLGGVKITDQSLAHAREMVESAGS